jgi:hypothetical protein
MNSEKKIALLLVAGILSLLLSALWEGLVFRSRIPLGSPAMYILRWVFHASDAEPSFGQLLGVTFAIDSVLWFLLFCAVALVFLQLRKKKRSR